MNILTDRLPDSLNIDGAEYPIYTDYRNWIKIDLILSDNKANPIEALSKAVILCYKVLPPNLKEAVNAMLEFYRGRKQEGKSETKASKAVYSFEHDSEYIYSSFLSQYNIDLTIENMHWWKFKALFSSLDSECMFSKVVQYRSINLNSVKDKEQKKFYRKMKRLYALPDKRTEKEKEDSIIASLNLL